MALHSNIRDQAYAFFTEEAPELLQAIEVELLTLQERNPNQIHTLMRAAHSLKGGAASVGLDAIAALAHRLEDIFKALYSDTLELSFDLEELIFKAYDCLRLPLMEQITSGTFDAEQALAIADPIFNQLEERCGDALTETQSYIPSSIDMGVDMVASIFEVDVAQGLDRLAAVIADPQNYEVAGELRSQVEVFAGFAELLNLSDFGSVAETVQQALEIHPDRAVEIAELALADFAIIRQTVLAGNSVSERNQQSEAIPSAALKAFTQAGLVQPRLIQPQLIQPVLPPPVASKNEAIAPPAIEVDDLESPISLSDLESIFGVSSEVTDPISIEVIDESAEPDQQLEELHSDSSIHSSADITALEVEADEFNQAEINSEPIDVEWVDSASEATEELPLPPSGALQIRQPTELYYQPRTQPEWIADSDRSIEAVAANRTVRVDSVRLEKMNNLVGELAINRDALSLQNDQLQDVVKELLDRFGRFQGMVSQLQELSDQMLVAPERHSTIAASAENGEVRQFNSLYPLADRATAASSTTAEFDSLEMDRYGALHPQLQEILENLVQLEETVDDVALFARQSNQGLDQQRNRLSQLQDELISARMLPLGEILKRFPRLLRDLSNTYHKPVQLKLTGTNVLIEKAILEKLYDPLLHLLRNAFDHGIEPTILRRERQKPEQGQIEIKAYHKGNQTIIEITDDGQGLNLDRIRRRVLELGWLSAEQTAELSSTQLLEFIFESGFSTADRLSELSGRGVGLDVVRSQLRSIKGSVAVKSLPQQGTTFTLALPLTLTITKLIICLVGSAAFALPADGIEEILTPQPLQTRQSSGQRFLHWREQWIPTYRLVDFLEYACPRPELSMSKTFITVPSPEDWALPLLVLRQDNQIFALEVDRLVTEQELVIKPFGDAIASPSYTYGCTILGDGSLVPIIDGGALLAFSRQARTSVGISSLATTRSTIQPDIQLPGLLKIKQAPTVLVVDDAATLRQTLALSLERLGFRVLQARDGREAIAQLQQTTSVNLIVCDVEMPNMNGFEFLSYRRQNSEIAAAPVVMLTSRSNDKHRWLAMQLGATAYFTKPYLEQEFLAALKKLLD